MASGFFSPYGINQPYGNTQSYQSTQYFPQPQGNVYMVNNSLEVANIPMGAGISAVICPSEGILYLKTMQNGAPTLMAYKINPYDSNNHAQNQEDSKSKSTKKEEFPNYDEKITKLEQQIEKIKKALGGTYDGLI